MLKCFPFLLLYCVSVYIFSICVDLDAEVLVLVLIGTTKALLKSVSNHALRKTNYLTYIMDVNVLYFHWDCLISSPQIYQFITDAICHNPT